jgi:hypothetical protein
LTAPGFRLTGFVGMLRSNSQEQWRGEIMRLRANNPGISLDAASISVIAKAWDKVEANYRIDPGNAPVMTTPGPKPEPKIAPALKAAPTAAAKPTAQPAPKAANTIRQQRPTVPLRLTAGMKNFCEQCDCLRTVTEISNCKSRFCPWSAQK